MTFARTVGAALAVMTTVAVAAGCTSAHTGGSTTTSTAAHHPRPSTGSSSTTLPLPATTTTTISTTSTTGSPTQALVGTLQSFFAGGCSGACTRLTEPATAFSVTLDQHNPIWARWSVVDPSIGSGYGFAQLSGGSWAVVAGPGSAEVGCPSSGAPVPAQVLADFGATCPAGT